jgi:ADP-dependent NAD(P)H-hydrate dehydratase / NAD(P)H-hydrate epimerase
MTHHTPKPDPKRDVFGRADVLLPTAAEAAAADRAARTAFGVPERVLMETAGRAAAMVLHRLHPSGTVAGVAGSGNNGGDLLVMLRVLREWGRDVTVAAVGTAAPDPALAHGADLTVLADDDAGALALARADVVVDGMLGTGSAGAPRGRIAEWIERINESGRPVLALDLPSGVDATTGAVPGRAVRATTDRDVRLAEARPAPPSRPPSLRPPRGRGDRVPVAVGGSQRQGHHAGLGQAALRRREPVAHKGSAGRLFILAGSSGMAGAAALAAEAAIRAGGGLLRVASCATIASSSRRWSRRRPSWTATIWRMRTSIPCMPWSRVRGWVPTRQARHALLRGLELTAGKPTLIDADGLNIIAAGEAGYPGPHRRGPAARDHPARPGTVPSQRDRPRRHPRGPRRRGTLRRGARFGCTVLLKGQPSLVAAPDGALMVNTVGSSDVAAAGTGDQLAGTIGALLAGGMPPAAAAALGLFLSGRAADLAALGRRCRRATCPPALPRAMAWPGPSRSDLALPFITFDQPPRW